MNSFMLQLLLRNIGIPFIPASQEFVLLDEIGGSTVLNTEEDIGVLTELEELLLENGESLLDETLLPMTTE